MFSKNLIRRAAALSLALILALSLTIPSASAGWLDPPATAAAFRIRPGDGYFRISVQDEKGLRADSNAYFTDEVFAAREEGKTK